MWSKELTFLLSILASRDFAMSGKFLHFLQSENIGSPDGDPIRPIHKKEETFLEKNYRGITLSSCLGKFFNNLLPIRLSKCFEELKLFQDHMMGFRPNMRTSYDVFVLKTLIDKQFHKGQKLYCCFLDFATAFDTIWRKGLLSKLKTIGIEGKMFNIIRDLYSNTNGHVAVENLMSE